MFSIFVARPSGGPWAPQGPKREVPGTPRDREKGPDGPPRAPKAPPRAPWEPKGPFWRCSFFLKENVHRAPRAPKSDLIFVFVRRFGGPKNAQVAFSGAPGRAYKSLWGPFGLLLGPSRSEKSIFRDLRWNVERDRFAQSPRSAPGTPEGPPRTDFGAILVVSGSISEPLWGSTGRFWDRFCTDWVPHVGRCRVGFRITCLLYTSDAADE